MIGNWFFSWDKNRTLLLIQGIRLKKKLKNWMFPVNFTYESVILKNLKFMLYTILFLFILYLFNTNQFTKHFILWIMDQWKQLFSNYISSKYNTHSTVIILYRIELINVCKYYEILIIFVHKRAIVLLKPCIEIWEVFVQNLSFLHNNMPWNFKLTPS